MSSLLRVTVFVALASGFVQLKPDWFPPRDFVEYWSAATVLAHGGNPYDGSQLLVVQHAVEIEEFEKKKGLGEVSQSDTPELKTQAVSLWTPPWTLPMYLPFGFLPFAFAHQVWLIVQWICIGVAVEFLCGSLRFASRLSGYVLVVLFSPVFWDLHFGQNTAFILLGLAGFLRFRDTKSWLAGAFVALTAIKPHLLAAFGVLLVLDTLRPKGTRVLLTGIATLAVGSMIAIAFDPGIFGKFADAIQKPSTPDTVSLKDWQVPLFSYHLRQAVNKDAFWIQFTPCLTACLIATAYSVTARRNWDWARELPRWVVLGLLTAPYGAWIFDLTLLIVPLFAGARLVANPGGLLAQVAYFGGVFLVSVFGWKISGLAEAWWFTPAFACLYLLAEIAGRKESSWRGTNAL